MAALLIIAAGPVGADVVTDGTVGPVETLDGAEVEVREALGRREGGNLFHSFEAFGVLEGQSVTFTGDPEIANVISRVTGGDISEIDGRLASEIGSADFWFVNPAGVTFGPNAALDVPAAFHLATADQIEFPDGAVFSATDPSASSFTVAAPEAFGFLGADPGAIEINGSTLSVAEGEAMTLAGGDIMVSEGQVSGPGGRLTLDSSAATAPRDGDGSIDIERSAVSVASETLGGAIDLRGGNLNIRNSSFVTANTSTSPLQSRGIQILAGTFTIEDRSFLISDALGPGNGGAIRIDADHVSVLSGSLVGASTLGDGDAGGVAVGARTVLVDGNDALGFPTGIISHSTVTPDGNLRASGDGGLVRIVADQVNVMNDGFIASDTFADGNAGNVKLIGNDLVQLQNNGRISSDVQVSVDGSIRGTGDGGQVAVTAGHLEILRGAEIQTSTFADGNAGSVDVVADSILIERQGSSEPTGIFSESGVNRFTRALAKGDAGAVRVWAQAVEIRDGGEIQSRTFTSGGGGDVFVKANSVELDRDGSAFPTGISSSASSSDQIVASGPSGTVHLQAGSILIVDRARVSASSVGAGDAGAVEVVAERLELRDDATIDSATFGSGMAGSVSVDAPTIILIDGGSIASSSLGAGRGGGVRITGVERLTMEDGADITAATAEADGGDIVIEVSDVIDLFESRITTSVAEGEGNGGNIFIDPKVLALNRSDIIANARQGAGGNITIVADQLLQSNDSVISASGAREGTVTISSRDEDIAERIVVPDAVLVDASDLVREACAARRDEDLSSFTGVGRDALPASPDDPLGGSFGAALGALPPSDGPRFHDAITVPCHAAR